ncbi:putative telomere-associated protein RIF1-like [Ditylenchus destructor]|uniref:Telomere-associated protein RIF1-like n=1 Tax=Ditylenchus destructor TaxID=166010 RepID=A0AAD4N6Z6_9BILA|nr:putative telomere-associated protein RIF1-like [Ditylenchus destructor]
MTINQVEMVRIVHKLTLIKKKPNVTDRRNIYSEILLKTSIDTLKEASKQCSDWIVYLIRDALTEASLDDAQTIYSEIMIRVIQEGNISFNDTTIAEIVKELSDFVDLASKAIRSGKATAISVLITWASVIDLLYKEIISNHEIINTICPVFALAFKLSDEAAVSQAYKSWKHLICAFEKDAVWTSPPSGRVGSFEKRLELILKPLRHNISVNASLEIFNTWWTLALSLKQNLSFVFEQVLHGLLRFCVGGDTLYLPPDIDASSVISEVTKPMESRSKLVSTMNDALNRIKFTRAALKSYPELLPKLFELVENILGDYGLFSEAFKKPVIVETHSIYLIQCIRWLSFKLSPNDVNIESFSTLWSLVLKRINSALEGEKKQLQLRYFCAQMFQWTQENNIPKQLITKAIIALTETKILQDMEEFEPLQSLLPGPSRKRRGAVFVPATEESSTIKRNKEPIIYVTLSPENAPIQSAPVTPKLRINPESPEVVFATSSNMEPHMMSESIGLSERTLNQLLPTMPETPKIATPTSILRKGTSPGLSDSTKKNRRVHFGAEVDAPSPEKDKSTTPKKMSSRRLALPSQVATPSSAVEMTSLSNEVSLIPLESLEPEKSQESDAVKNNLSSPQGKRMRIAQQNQQQQDDIMSLPIKYSDKLGKVRDVLNKLYVPTVPITVEESSDNLEANKENIAEDETVGDSIEMGGKDIEQLSANPEAYKENIAEDEIVGDSIEMGCKDIEQSSANPEGNKENIAEDEVNGDSIEMIDKINEKVTLPHSFVSLCEECRNIVPENADMALTVAERDRIMMKTMVGLQDIATKIGKECLRLQGID